MYRLDMRIMHVVEVMVSGIKTVRKNINFPIDLVEEINCVTKELKIDFSKFIREASEEYVSHIKKAELEKELEEGYRAKAKLNLKICEDFKHVNGENL